MVPGPKRSIFSVNREAFCGYLIAGVDVTIKQEGANPL